MNLTSWGTVCDLKISNISIHSVVAQKVLDLGISSGRGNLSRLVTFALSEKKKKKEKETFAPVQLGKEYRRQKSAIRL